jgi:aspartyl-tRNA(Asn)/glutamyl-tRNA(Gln) amidotransferase subunit A
VTGKQDLTDLTLVEFAEGYRRGDWTSEEVTKAHLDRIARVEPGVEAYVTVDGEGALEAAREADRSAPPAKERPLLWGAPLALKDNICTRSIRTTCSSRFLEEFRPPYDATVVLRLRNSGAVILGKTNLDEFAMGSSTENSAFKATRNPWNPALIPGGSSGGAAAAVAAGECLAALGSDTGGSIRQPAAHCGVTALKPTYGLVSRYGLVAFASSLDQIGPLARTAEDCAVLLEAVAGNDHRDSTSAPVEIPPLSSLVGKGMEGMKFGVLREHLEGGLDPAVKEAVERSVATLQSLGAEAIEISLPHGRYAVAAYYILATAEASSNLARYDGVKYGFRADGAEDLSGHYLRTRREGFGTEVKRRIMLGTYVLSSGYYDAYYRKAQQVRTLIRRDFTEAFEEVDFLVGPTTPTAAFPIGEKADDPLQMYLSDIFTISVNLAGVPALALPCGATPEGLPLGLQMIAAPFREETILRAGHAFQQATDHHLRRPPLSPPGGEDKGEGSRA